MLKSKSAEIFEAASGLFGMRCAQTSNAVQPMDHEYGRTLRAWQLRDSHSAGAASGRCGRHQSSRGRALGERCRNSLEYRMSTFL